MVERAFVCRDSAGTHRNRQHAAHEARDGALTAKSAGFDGITDWEWTPRGDPATPIEDSGRATRPAVPEKYLNSKTSGLTLSLEKNEGSKTFDINLIEKKNQSSARPES